MTGLLPLPWQNTLWQLVAPAVQQQRLSHALLLAGPSGVGKRHFAGLLIRALLCLHADKDSLPCGHCRSCLLINAGTHPDFYRLEKEEGSKVLKVDDVRAFNRKVFLTPKLGRGNVGIIDPVDDLNHNSANALLKSLEEPPPGTHILLVGERWMGLPATLRSRCLVLRFPIPEENVVTKWLADQTGSPSTLTALRTRYQPDLARQKEWLEGLATICTGKGDPVILAERWLKLETELPVLLDWMHGCIADMLKLKAGAAQTSLRHSHSLKPLQALAAAVSQPVLLRLADRCVASRRLLETQARPQMVLENLLLSWYQDSKPVTARA